MKTSIDAPNIKTISRRDLEQSRTQSRTRRPFLEPRPSRHSIALPSFPSLVCHANSTPNVASTAWQKCVIQISGIRMYCVFVIGTLLRTAHGMVGCSRHELLDKLLLVVRVHSLLAMYSHSFRSKYLTWVKVTSYSRDDEVKTPWGAELSILMWRCLSKHSIDLV